MNIQPYKVSGTVNMQKSLSVSSQKYGVIYGSGNVCSCRY